VTSYGPRRVPGASAMPNGADYRRERRLELASLSTLIWNQIRGWLAAMEGSGSRVNPYLKRGWRCLNTGRQPSQLLEPVQHHDEPQLSRRRLDHQESTAVRRQVVVAPTAHR